MYDILILGSGTAGLSAAIYARRFELKTLVLGDVPGGTIIQTHLVENYPGYQSLTGLELGQKFIAHAENLATEMQNQTVTAITKNSSGFLVQTSTQNFSTKTLVFATGTKHRRLAIPGEKKLEGRGVSFCATCDAPFFREQTTAIIGGSDSAVKEALVLAKHAQKVFLIYRGAKLRAEPINLRRMENDPKIEPILNEEITEIFGENKVTGVQLKSGSKLDLTGVFIEIGRLPKTELAVSLGLALNAKKEIKIDRASRTSIPGVFAAGDCTASDFKQAITAAAEGAHAANSAFDFLSKKPTPAQQLLQRIQLFGKFKFLAPFL